jgi:hypothetical protein
MFLIVNSLVGSNDHTELFYDNQTFMIKFNFLVELFTNQINPLVLPPKKW